MKPADTIVGLIASDVYLTQMVRQAAVGLGIELRVLAPPRTDCPPDTNTAPRDDCRNDLAALIALAARCDVVTFASDTISPRHLDVLSAAGITLRPSAQAAELASDATTARRVLHDCGFDVAPIPANTVSATGSINHSGPQHDHIRAGRASPSGAPGAGGLTVVIARRPSAHHAAYPIVAAANTGPPHLGPPPAPAAASLAVEHVVATAISIADGIDATGIISIEFLLTTDGRPLINHITLGPQPDSHLHPGVTSQFENHLRAILDWPLGATTIGTH